MRTEPIKPASRPVKITFGAFATLVRDPGWLFLNPTQDPNLRRDPSKPEDRSWLGVGDWKLFLIADLKEMRLYTNCMVNAEGDAVTTNYTEVFDNFALDDKGQVHLGTKLKVDEKSGICKPWYKL